MYLEVTEFLSPEECEQVLALACDGRFQDGQATAHYPTEGIKRNLQLEPEQAQARFLDQLLQHAIDRQPLVQDFIQAAMMKGPLLSRYEPGMYYGRHLDAPILPHGLPMRSDISITVFLSDPESYDGGNLVLETDYGDIDVKLGVGDAVIYYTHVYHQVEPVTRGERMAIVTWFQSRIRDPMLRMALFDLTQAWREVSAAAPESAAAERLNKTIGNLTRLWSET